MDNLQFIQGLYNGKNCYSDAMTDEQIELLHIESGVEAIIKKMINERRIVFLTGNPGDGKTYIIRSEKELLKGVYTVPDLNSIVLESKQGAKLLEKLYDCYIKGNPCVIAANEFPFHKLTIKLKYKYPDMYEELNAIRQNVLHTGYSTVELKRICIIDLNERNLLDKDRINSILNKFTTMLKPYRLTNTILAHNIEALSNAIIQEQLFKVFANIAMTGKHFVIRDILGTLSYILLGCTYSNYEGSGFYYDDLFEGSNEIMSFASQFDPIFLSYPSLDERLWNGDQIEGWMLDVPDKWPYQIIEGKGAVETATKLFKSIKRKFYFENVYAKELSELQPLDLNECIDVFMRIKQDAKRIKKMLVSSMNKIYLSTDNEKDKLRIWTTHNYDLSRTVAAAASTRYIDIDDLGLVYPEPVEWLQSMEYVPTKIIMYCIKNPEHKIEIDIEFLRRLIMIKNGYPASLLSEQYEQLISQFTKNLTEVSKDYADGEILVCNRKSGLYKKIYIKDDKYSLGSEADY